jgi:hypothetical protein
VKATLRCPEAGGLTGPQGGQTTGCSEGCGPTKPQDGQTTCHSGAGGPTSTQGGKTAWRSVAQAISMQRSMAEGTSYGVEIELKEEKVYTHLDEEKESDVRTSVLDIEATNHMSGSRAKVMRLDTVVLGTVHFGDDSVAQIEGHGTIVFVCKNDESRSLDGIYLIP